MSESQSIDVLQQVGQSQPMFTVYDYPSFRGGILFTLSKKIWKWDRGDLKTPQDFLDLANPTSPSGFACCNEKAWGAERDQAKQNDRVHSSVYENSCKPESIMSDLYSFHLAETGGTNDDREHPPMQPLPPAIIVPTPPMVNELPLLDKPAANKEGRVIKNPKAPKRFKSSYILFFTAKQAEIKEQLGSDADMSSISKKSSELWKKLSPEERAIWDERAAADKARYNMEKLNYNGPWQVPWKRQRKDPSAPKRPMSAFLFFSQVKRGEVRAANPTLKNVEVSRALGSIWRSMTEAEKEPFVKIEEKARGQYKVELEKWKKRKSEREAAARQEALQFQETEFQELNHESFRHDGTQNDGLQWQQDFMYSPAYIPSDGLGATANSGIMNSSYTMQPPNFFSPPPQSQSTGLSLPLPTTGKPVVLGPAGLPIQPIPQAAPSIFDDAFDFTADHVDGEG